MFRPDFDHDSVFVRNSCLVDYRTIAIAEHWQWIYRNISNFLILSLSRSPSRGRLLGSQNRISCADHRRLSTLKLASFGCLEFFPRVGPIYRHCGRKLSIIQFIFYPDYYGSDKPRTERSGIRQRTRHTCNDLSDGRKEMERRKRARKSLENLSQVQQAWLPSTPASERTTSAW